MVGHSTDCSGDLRYLGGVAVLAPDSARCGECRSGVTQMEASYGLNGSKAGPLAQLQVLGEGQNLEGNELRCPACNGGVACGNVSAGVGFFVSPERYELNYGIAESASPAPPAASKTP